MTQISFGVSNSTVLMKPWPMTPRNAAGRKARSTPSTKRRVRASLGKSPAIFSSRAEIDGQYGEDRAELDQYLERLAGRLEAEEMTGEQYVAGRGDRDELGQPFEQAKHQGVDERLIFHDFLDIREQSLLLVTARKRPYRSVGRSAVAIPKFGARKV